MSTYQYRPSSGNDTDFPESEPEVEASALYEADVWISSSEDEAKSSKGYSLCSLRERPATNLAALLQLAQSSATEEEELEIINKSSSTSNPEWRSEQESTESCHSVRVVTDHSKRLDSAEVRIRGMLRRMLELKNITDQREDEFFILCYDVAKNEEDTHKLISHCQKSYAVRKNMQRMLSRIKITLKRLKEEIVCGNLIDTERDILVTIEKDTGVSDERDLRRAEKLLKLRMGVLNEARSLLCQSLHSSKSLKSFSQELADDGKLLREKFMHGRNLGLLSDDEVDKICAVLIEHSCPPTPIEEQPCCSKDILKNSKNLVHVIQLSPQTSTSKPNSVSQKITAQIPSKNERSVSNNTPGVFNFNKSRSKKIPTQPMKTQIRSKATLARSEMTSRDPKNVSKAGSLASKAVSENASATGSKNASATGSKQASTTGTKKASTTGTKKASITGSKNVSTTGSKNHSTTGSKNPSTTGSKNLSTTGSKNLSTTGSKNHASTASKNHSSTGSKNPSTTGSKNPSTTGSKNPSTIGSKNPSTTGSELPSATGSKNPSIPGSKNSSTSGSKNYTTGSEHPSTNSSNHSPSWFSTIERVSLSNPSLASNTSSPTNKFLGVANSISQESNNNLEVFSKESSVWLKHPKPSPNLSTGRNLEEHEDVLVMNNARVVVRRSKNDDQQVTITVTTNPREAGSISSKSALDYSAFGNTPPQSKSEFAEYDESYENYDYGCMSKFELSVSTTSILPQSQQLAVETDWHVNKKPVLKVQSKSQIEPQSQYRIRQSDLIPAKKSANISHSPSVKPRFQQQQRMPVDLQSHEMKPRVSTRSASAAAARRSVYNARMRDRSPSLEPASRYHRPRGRR